MLSLATVALWRPPLPLYKAKLGVFSASAFLAIKVNPKIMIARITITNVVGYSGIIGVGVGAGVVCGEVVGVDDGDTLGVGEGVGDGVGEGVGDGVGWGPVFR